MRDGAALGPASNAAVTMSRIKDNASSEVRSRNVRLGGRTVVDEADADDDDADDAEVERFGVASSGVLGAVFVGDVGARMNAADDEAARANSTAEILNFVMLLRSQLDRKDDGLLRLSMDQSGGWALNRRQQAAT